MIVLITAQSGMVNIDNQHIAYGNIRNMYKTGDGNGLQIEAKLEYKRKEILDICGEIADKIYKLQDILKEETR